MTTSPKAKKEAPVETPVNIGEATGESKKKLYKLSDELIGMVRELVQLALLTGTNIVDHLRAVVIQESDSDGRFVTVSPEYIEAYNQMILKLSEEAEQKMKEMQESLADDSGVSPAERN